MSFTVTVLGSSSALPTTRRFPTAHVLAVHERFFLIDCGEGTQIQMRRFSISMSKINHIFISHLHGDHIFGLFGLFSSFSLMGRKNDLHVYAHRDLEDTLQHFRNRFGVGMPYQIVFHPFTAERQKEIYNDKHMTVDLVPLRHSIPVAGFLFREKPRLLNIRKECIAQYGLGIRDIRRIKEGYDHLMEDGRLVPNGELTLPPVKPKSYAFCTDTTAFPRLSECLKGVDLLYFEATFSEKDKKLAKATGHSTAAQAALIAQKAGAGRLLIGHFSSRYKSIEPLLEEARSVFPDTTAVEDGDVFTV
jgi:ribonuclease Z